MSGPILYVPQWRKGPGDDWFTSIGRFASRELAEAYARGFHNAVTWPIDPPYQFRVLRYEGVQCGAIETVSARGL